MTDHIDDEELDENDSEEDEENLYETPLAKEFAAHCKKIGQQIDTHVEAARQELKSAIDLSEKHGVPFRPGISFLNNTYMPESFFGSKFSKLDQEVVCEIAEVWGSYIFEGGGWEHSAIC
jgi:hypothetical protein